MNPSLLLLMTVVAGAVDVPSRDGHVVDRASVLTGSERSNLEARLQQYEDSTGHDLVVLTVPSLGEESIEQYSMRVAETWKPGNAHRDDGLILLLAPTERQVRIEVGAGLEGAIPDAVASRVIRDSMTPLLKQGRTAEALNAGITSLMAAAQHESTAPPTAPDFPDVNWYVTFAILMMVSMVLSRLHPLPRSAVVGTVGLGVGWWLMHDAVSIMMVAGLGLLLGLGGAHLLGRMALGRLIGGGGHRSSGGGGHFSGGGASGRY